MATRAKKAGDAPKVADFGFVYDALVEEYGPLDDLTVTDTLDLIIFSQLVQAMQLADAVKAYNVFKAQFVDWNEVRISTAREVQDVVKQTEEPLEFALFLKEFLNRLFIDHHHVGIEFLKDLTNTEIRAFFRKTPGFVESTIHHLLERIREYPVVPLESSSHALVERLGWADPSGTPLQKQKDLYSHFEREQVLPLSAYLQEHARSTCVTDATQLDCAACVLHSGCPFPRRTVTRRKRKKKSS